MNWTELDYQSYLSKRNQQIVKVQTQQKYNNTKCSIDGYPFDSKAEAREYERLKLLKMAGEIKSIELQPKFLLQPSYRRGGKTIRAVHYIADFRVVLKDGTVQVIDVKSEITEKNQVYRLKRKLLLFKYPQINFVEVQNENIKNYC